MQNQQELIAMLEEVLGMSMSAAIISEIPGLVINLVAYILTAVALYTMAKRRGILRPWLAWIPIANIYLFGCISDHYRSVALGQTKNRRKVLLGLEIPLQLLSAGVVALAISMLASMLAMGLDVLMDPDSLAALGEEQVMEIAMTLLGQVAGLLLLALPMLVIAIIHTVFYYIALSDIFKSSDPANANVYLVLSIAVGIGANMLFGLPTAVLPAIFLMVCRNKDHGIPMRQEEQPVYEVPQWAPAQPQEDPWEQEAQQ